MTAQTPVGQAYGGTRRLCQSGLLRAAALELAGAMNFDGMWLPRDQDPRQSHPTRGERECLVGYLEHYPRTLALKCEGLDAEQLARRSVPPSAMSLLGLVRHMARVEQSWFRRVIEGDAGLPRLFADEDDDAGFGFGTVDDQLVDQAFELWRTEMAYAREVLDRSDLDRVVDVDGETIQVRDVVVHMIEEYARHCGHADLVRECIDGRTGQ